MTSPSVYGNYRKILNLSRMESSQIMSADICGNTTYSRDFLGRNIDISSETTIGDTLAILDCGAYGYYMSSRFLNRPRPAEILITRESQIKLITKRETFSDLISHQTFHNKEV